MSGSPSSGESRMSSAASVPRRTVEVSDAFNENETKIKEDILKMIVGYLNSLGYNNTTMTLQDEANMKVAAGRQRQADFKAMKKLILDGAWTEVEKLVTKLGLKNHKAFLYAVYKQQYLEHIESGEFQKAFAYLTKRLKPLEKMQTIPGEFKDLCYLLTCNAVQDAPSFKNWEGVTNAREKLIEEFQDILIHETMESTNLDIVPQDRLLTVLKQGVAYQIEFSRYRPKEARQVTTLLEDYRAFVIPNAEKTRFIGHSANVKCIEFIGADGRHLSSGSSDNTIKVWDTAKGTSLATLSGHTSRIWDLSSTESGLLLASASGDGTVRIWDSKLLKSTSIGIYGDEKESDVYSVKFHPKEKHFVSGGYDTVLRLFDIETKQIVKSFSGHQSSISKAVFNAYGNLIISGSKDRSIKFWDITSGLCINSLTSHLGEVTSVALNSSGNFLLSSSKDNSHRLWDVRMGKTLMRFKGHQNTSKNFIRSGFGQRSLIMSGSEDGLIYIWDVDKGRVVGKLEGHGSITYNAVWNSNQSLVASCSEDKTLRTWWFDETKS